MQPDPGGLTNRELQTVAAPDIAVFAISEHWDGTAIDLHVLEQMRMEFRRRQRLDHGRIVARSRANMAAPECPFDDVATKRSDLVGDLT